MPPETTSAIFATKTHLLSLAIFCEPENFLIWLEENKNRLSVSPPELAGFLEKSFPNNSKFITTIDRPDGLKNNAFLTNAQLRDDLYTETGKKMHYKGFSFGPMLATTNILFDQEAKTGATDHQLHPGEDRTWNSTETVVAHFKERDLAKSNEQSRLTTLGSMLQKDLKAGNIKSLIRTPSTDLPYLPDLLTDLNLNHLSKEDKVKVAIWYKAALSKDQKVTLYENHKRILPQAFAPLAAELVQEKVITPVTWAVMRDETRNDFIQYLAPAQVPFALDPVPNNPYFKEPKLVTTLQGKSHIDSFITNSTGPMAQACVDRAKAFLNRSKNNELSTYLADVIANHPGLLYTEKYGAVNVYYR